MKKKYVIIGNSAAGLSAARKLRQLDEHAEIICVSQEKELPYNKCTLVDYVSGDLEEEDLYLDNVESLKAKKITMVFGKKVIKVVSDNKALLLEDGKKISYDILFISTGASPIKPDIKGNHVSGVFTFHTLHDITTLLEFIKTNNVKNVVIIGSGMTGLECADALLKRNLNVNLVEMSGHVLAYQSDKVSSEIIQDKMLKSGITLVLNEKVEEIISENGVLSCVALSSGEFIPADIVICTVGVKPNIDFLKDSGIEISGNGILVNDYMQTNVEDIFAGGDVAIVKDFISGHKVRSCTWPDACMQAMVAASNMAGEKLQYEGALSMIYSEIFGLSIASCLGSLNHRSKYDEFVKKGENFYNKIFIKDGFVQGFLLIGNIDNVGILKRCIMVNQPFDASQLSY